MSQRIGTAAMVLSCILVGCVDDNPLTRVGACVAAASGQRLADPDGECDLGRRAYLIVLPRNATASDLIQLGLPKWIVFALTEGSSLAGPRWCSVTTKAGELPTPADLDAGQVECIESSVEIDSPALLETDSVRIHLAAKHGERPRVTGVEAIGK